MKFVCRTDRTQLLGAISVANQNYQTGFCFRFGLSVISLVGILSSSLEIFLWIRTRRCEWRTCMIFLNLGNANSFLIRRMLLNIFGFNWLIVYVRFARPVITDRKFEWDSTHEKKKNEATFTSCGLHWIRTSDPYSVKVML